jgi:carboxymethylenebutenolidase
MCFEFDALPPRVPEDRVIPALAGGAGAERLTLESADGTPFAAALAECPEPTGGPAVIVLPDVRGLYRFYVDLAERFVTAGHHAIAIDYFGRTAGVDERDDEFDFMTHTMQTTPAQVQADIAAAREALA